jgi:putative flippase GtrA
MIRPQSARSAPPTCGTTGRPAFGSGAALVKFVLVGTVGFCVDYGVLRLLVTEFDWHWALARGPSFTLAVGVTWMLNRRFTFGSSNRWLGESFRYLITQVIGSVINLAVFSGIVVVFGEDDLLVPLAAGAAAGLVFNFLMSKHVVFGQPTKGLNGYD